LASSFGASRLKIFSLAHSIECEAGETELRKKTMIASESVLYENGLLKLTTDGNFTQHFTSSFFDNRFVLILLAYSIKVGHNMWLSVYWAYYCWRNRS